MGDGGEMGRGATGRRTWGGGKRGGGEGRRGVGGVGRVDRKEGERGREPQGGGDWEGATRSRDGEEGNRKREMGKRAVGRRRGRGISQIDMMECLGGHRL